MRIMFYTDGRHTHLYQLEPPLTLEQLRIPVDELLGTMVDTIVLCLGVGVTYLHDTKVGDLWGTIEEEQGDRSWSNLVFYRAGENLRQSLQAGYDPLRILAERAHEKGLEFIASLRMNPAKDYAHTPGTGRLSRFRRNHPELEIGEFPAVSAASSLGFDYSYKPVRDERLAIITEICERYPVGGFELDMSFPTYFFKPNEAERKHEIMTRFIRDVRTLMDKTPNEGSRQLVLSAKVPATIESCNKLGIDVITWIREGFLNIVVPCTLDGALIDINLPLEEWVEAAKGTGCKVYGCVTPSVNDDRRVAATADMYRAAALNYWRAGVNGIYLSNFWSRGWPFNPEDYVILREIGDQEVIEHKDKHYWVRTRGRGDHAPPPFLYPRQLPVILDETPEGPGRTIRLKVADDIEPAARVGILSLVKLRLRIKNLTKHDELSFELNSTPLLKEFCKRFDFTYRLLSPARSVERRLLSHYTFDFDLTQGPFPLKGWNEITVNLEKRDPKIGDYGYHPERLVETDVILNDVELIIRYRISRHYPRFEEETDL